MPRTATVKRLTFPEGRRVLAISDIHGNLPFLKGVLAAAHYGPDDILVLVGDLVEKGPDSLTTLRFIMELAEWNTVYGLRGNCDNLVSEFVAARGEEERFYRHYVDVWRDRCLLVQMGHAAGFETRGPEELPALREVVRARFGPELAFLEAMPEILLTPDYLFVHGGVADEAHLEGLDAWKCMKNDDFLSQGHSFRRWCIVGHWPVTLYHPHVPSAAPLLAEGRHIASIDGGCSLKVDGQLNALEVLERGAELSLCRHLETGRVLEVLTEYLYVDRGVTRCEDSTDYRLAVRPGDTLSVVRRISDRALVKKDGVTGWYFGRLAH